MSNETVAVEPEPDSPAGEGEKGKGPTKAPARAKPKRKKPASKEARPSKAPAKKKPAKKKGRPLGWDSKSMVKRGTGHAFASPLAQSARDQIIAMLKDKDPYKVAAKFHKTRSWINYLTHGRATPSLETIEALAKGLGYKASISIRKG
jgi:hypothetical protein